MKTKTLSSAPNATLESEQTVVMSIDSDGMKYVMQRLTGLYSKVAESVIREALSNALDSHVEAGQTSRKVKVTLPKLDRWGNQPSNDLLLVIEDFGVGMSEEQIRNVYARYGASTKRTTNKQRGGFGLGAKSALALADKFEVVSIKDGELITAEVGISDGVGYVTVLSTVPTDKGNGFKVSIPVPHKNVKDELNLEYVIKSNMFFGINPNDLEVNYFGEDALKLPNLYNGDFAEKKNLAGRVVGWVANNPAPQINKYAAKAPREKNLFAVVGGLTYRVKIDALILKEHQALNRLTEYGHDVYLNLPIGTIDFTPSREEFVYNDVTWRTLDNVASEMTAVVEQETIRHISSQADRRSAAIAYAKALDVDFWRRSVVVWNGEVIPTKIKLSGDYHYIERPIGSPRNAGRVWDVQENSNKEFSLFDWFESSSVRYVIPAVEDVSGNLQFSGGKPKLTAISSKLKSEGKTGKIALYYRKKDAAENEWLKAGLTPRTLEALAQDAKRIRAGLPKDGNPNRTASASLPGNPYFMLDLSVPVARRDPAFKGAAATYQYQVVSTPVKDMVDQKVLYVHPNGGSNARLNSLIPTEFATKVTSKTYADAGAVRSIQAALPGRKVVFLKGSQSLEKFKSMVPDAEPLASVLSGAMEARKEEFIDKLVAYRAGFLLLQSSALKTLINFVSSVPVSRKADLPEDLLALTAIVEAGRDASTVSSLWTGLTLWLNRAQNDVDELARESVTKFAPLRKKYLLLDGYYNDEFLKDNAQHLMDYVAFVNVKR